MGLCAVMSPVMQRLLGVAAGGERDLDEELSEMQRKEQEDLAILRQELDDREPTEEDRRLEALRHRAEVLRRRPARRRGCRRPEQVAYARAVATAAGAVARREADPYAAFRRSPDLYSAAVASAVQPESPPAPWQVIFDMGSGSWYYYNEETNVTTWDAPAMAERPPEPPAPWQLVPHAGSCAWYYHNTATGETSWEAPRGDTVSTSASLHISVCDP